MLTTAGQSTTSNVGGCNHTVAGGANGLGGAFVTASSCASSLKYAIVYTAVFCGGGGFFGDAVAPNTSDTTPLGLDFGVPLPYCDAGHSFLNATATYVPQVRYFQGFPDLQVVPNVFGGGGGCLGTDSSTVSGGGGGGFSGGGGGGGGGSYGGATESRPLRVSCTHIVPMIQSLPSPPRRCRDPATGLWSRRSSPAIRTPSMRRSPPPISTVVPSPPRWTPALWAAGQRAEPGRPQRRCLQVRFCCTSSGTESVARVPSPTPS